MKIVLDTNVLVSGLLNAKGNPAQIVNLVLSGSLQVCHNDAIISEYTEVLARLRFKFDPLQVAAVLEKLMVDGIRVHSSLDHLDLPDPDDEAFLTVAIASSGDFLVTGNLAHFPAEKRRGCAVVSPAEFMVFWNSKQR
jgi:putative PIN family toxin of toxin-antitoxin system